MMNGPIDMSGERVNMPATDGLQVIPEAIVAAHSAICETDIGDCLEWRGRCVKAVEAAAPHLIREARAAELEAVGAGFMQDYSFQWSEPLLHRIRERAAAIRAGQ